MPEIHHLVLGSYRTNCYIIHAAGGSRCLVIDPGYEPDTVFAMAHSLGLTIEAILLTHGHFDHVGGVKALAEKVGCPVYLHPEDLKLPFPLTLPVGHTQDVQDGDTLSLAGLSVLVLHTPGHTHGSVCYLADDAMFSGDTLFAHSCGRTDLPGSSHREMVSSLARLAALEEDYAVYPGHGSLTRLSIEKETNPYLEG